MPAAVPPTPTPPPADRPSSDPRPSEATELELGSLHATLTPVTPSDPETTPKRQPSGQPEGQRPSLFARLSFAMPLALALVAGCSDPWGPRESVAPLEPHAPSFLILGTIPTAEVSAGFAHTCVLKTDGTAACWGSNYYQQAPPSRSATGGGAFTQVRAGADFTCALRADGAVECWGKNDAGQAPASRSVSTAGTKFVEVSPGLAYTCARRDDGAVECWGYDDNGQVGGAPTPGFHAGPFTQVSAGYFHTCAVTGAGAVECWGANALDEAPSHREASGGATFVNVSVSSYHTCAVNSLGVAECWGRNDYGQAPASRSASNGAAFVQISSADFHTCAVNTLGAVECWGRNLYGEAQSSRTPSKAGTTFTQVSASVAHTCMRRSDAGVECYGNNPEGETTVPLIRSYPTATLSVSPNPAVAGQTFTLALNNAQVPGATAPVTFTYAFDCGTGYGAFASSAIASCPAIFIGPRSVRAKVRDQDGDGAEYTGTIQVNAPPPPPATTSLLFWDFQNVTSAGAVSTAPSTTALAGLSGRASQTCGGPAEVLGTGTTLLTRQFGTCYPYLEITLTHPTYLVSVTFDHWHNHNDNTPAYPSYRAQLQLDAGTGYADIGNQWLLEGNNVPHVGADGAFITLNTALQPGTYRLRWMPRGLNPFDQWICTEPDGYGGCYDGYDERQNNPVDTGDQYFAVKNVRLNGYTLWDFTGFFQPVDNPPIVNTAKAGTAIPVKFGLGGDKGLAIFTAGSPQAQQVSCNSSAPTDAITQTVTAGASSLSYDPTTQQYTYVWKTDKAWANTCRQLTLQFADGTTRTASFKFN